MHDLFLVHHDAVRLARQRLHRRMLVRDLRAAVAALDEVGDQLHRPGPVERDHRDHVREPLGPEPTERLAHARGLQLKDAERPRLAQERVRLRVVEREGVEIDLDPPRLLDEGDTVEDVDCLP